MNSHLADQLRRAFEGGAWHGPAIFELLEDVDAPHAALGGSGTHTIWELTLHIAVWLEVANRRALGMAVEIDSMGGGFPDVASFSTESWTATRERLRDAFDELCATVGKLGDDDLERIVPQRDHSVRFMLDGVIQHSLYHAGQIALTKKLGPTDDRAMLRHTLATLAYRAEKALRDPPDGFAEHKIAPATRTPIELLGHLGDLIEWACSLAEGEWQWKPASAREWEHDAVRFFAGLARLDRRLASEAPLGHPATVIFQGPIADAFTHVGQIAMLRGHAGAPVRPESFARAEIVPGRVGREQSAERREFDGDASAKR